MSSLSPPAPPPNRHRASSTNVRPPLTLASCGRRRSSSLVDRPQTPTCLSPVPPTPRSARDLPPLSVSIPSPCSPREADKSTPRSKLASVLSQWTHSLHLSADSSFPSTPSTPLHSRASTDDSSILPMSASPTRSYFGDISFPEKPQPKLKARLWEGHPSVRLLPSSSRDVFVDPSPDFLVPIE